MVRRQNSIDAQPLLAIVRGGITSKLYDTSLLGGLPQDQTMNSKTVKRIFILSPANCSGLRAQLLMSERSSFALARQLRDGGASLGDIFSFMSALYFRGKLAYARSFANPPPGLPGTLIVTPGSGLRSPEDILTLGELKEIAGVKVDEHNLPYRTPLERDARRIAESIPAACEAVFLGSVATSKYLGILGDAFRERLRFPADFVGRGDMSRGGLMLRCVEKGEELTYVELAGAPRHGQRPPRLPKPNESQQKSQP
ncbi:MAG: hypothetical protein WAV47_20620 [Blastocatellia bacterium]